jgi:hypothetical protein
MSKIYVLARKVLVWLGTASDNSDSAFDVLQVTGISRHVVKGRYGGMPNVSIKGILDLMLRPYWHRLWIVQEISFASDDPIVGCGDKWLSWSRISDSLHELWTSLLHTEIRAMRGIPNRKHGCAERLV